MNVDITALRAVEKEKGIEFDSLIEQEQQAVRRENLKSRT